MKVIDKRAAKEEEKDDNTVVLRPDLNMVTGGKLPPGANWLSPLPKGTVFLCKMSTRGLNAQQAQQAGHTPGIQEYHIEFKGDKGVQLLENLNEKETRAWVDPFAFCRLFDLFEILYLPQEQEENQWEQS